MLQFGVHNPVLEYRHRATAFGIAARDGLIACVRVERPGGAYFDLPGGGVDVEESEVQALVREFAEETGLSITPENRITEATQYFRRSTNEPIKSVGGFWTVKVTGENPDARCEDDHTLVWLDPTFALSRLRHDSHVWALAVWLRRAS